MVGWTVVRVPELLLTTNGRHSRTRAPSPVSEPSPHRERPATSRRAPEHIARPRVAPLARASPPLPGASRFTQIYQTLPALAMASGLDALVGAATEGMRKTQSAEEMQPKENAEPKPAPAQDGHMSTHRRARARGRRVRELFSFAPERPTRFPRDARARNATERASASAVSPVTHALTAIPPSPHPGVPWTEDEHRLFLLGLKKLGKVRARFGFPTTWLFFSIAVAVPFSRSRARPDAARWLQASPGPRATRYRSRARCWGAPRWISRRHRHADASLSSHTQVAPTGARARLVAPSMTARRQAVPLPASRSRYNTALWNFFFSVARRAAARTAASPFRPSAADPVVPTARARDALVSFDDVPAFGFLFLPSG